MRKEGKSPRWRVAASAFALSAGPASGPVAVSPRGHGAFSCVPEVSWLPCNHDSPAGKRAPYLFTYKGSVIRGPGVIGWC